MLKKNGSILGLLIVATTVLVLSSMFLFKPDGGTVSAQEGGGPGKKVSNLDAWQGQVTEPAPGEAVASAYQPVSDDSGISPQSDGSGIEVIPIGAFKNDGDNVDGWFNSFSGGYIRNDGPLVACFMAPAYPPLDSTLTQIRISLLDNNANLNLFFAELKRINLVNGTVNKLAGGTVVWNDPNPVELFENISPNLAAVSSSYAYYFHLCFPANSGTSIQFYGARLFYTP